MIGANIANPQSILLRIDHSKYISNQIAHKLNLFLHFKYVHILIKEEKDEH